MIRTPLRKRKERVAPRLVLQIPQRDLRGWPPARKECIRRAEGKCARCRGPLGKRPEVNHITAIAEGGDPLDQANLEALGTDCPCHKQHTALLAARLAKAKRVAAKHGGPYVPPRFQH